MPFIDTIEAGATEYDILADGLKTAAEIDGIPFDGTQAISRYTVCSTGAATAAKTASIGNAITIDAGTHIFVKFTNGNTAENPTLSINSLGAAPIRTSGANPAGSGAWRAGEVLELVYDGISWQIAGGAIGSESTVGRLMLDTTMSEAGRAADAKAVGDAIYSAIYGAMEASY